MIAGGAKLLEVGEVAGDLGAGPVLSVDELAAEDPVLIDDVGFGQEGGAVELVDAAVGVTDGGDLDVVLGKEVAIDVVGLIHGDADDGELGHALVELEQAGELFDAGGAPGGPEIENHDAAAELCQVDGLVAVGDGELGRGFAEALGMGTAITADREGKRGETEGQGRAGHGAARGDGGRAAGRHVRSYNTKRLDGPHQAAGVGRRRAWCDGVSRCWG